jgi:hypothetical protein
MSRKRFTPEQIITKLRAAYYFITKADRPYRVSGPIHQVSTRSIHSQLAIMAKFLAEYVSVYFSQAKHQIELRAGPVV